MTDEPDHAQMDAFTKGLMIVMLFAAAQADADAAQRIRLRDEGVPMLRDHSNPLVWVVEKVLAIMGPEWTPTGEYGAYIDKLIADWQERHR